MQSCITGKSLSEALILESVNPKYDDRLFIDLRLQYKKNTSSEHDARMSSPQKDFPVIMIRSKINVRCIFLVIFTFLSFSFCTQFYNGEFSLQQPAPATRIFHRQVLMHQYHNLSSLSVV